MAVSRALNSNNDIFAKNGRIAIIEDGAEVVQSVKTRLQFIQGEWFLDTSSGVPYFSDIFVKPVNLGTTEDVIKSTITETDGVLSITTFNMDFDESTRELSVSFEAETTYGYIEVNDLYINTTI